MARTTAQRTARRFYVTTFALEGRRWAESVEAESLDAAVLRFRVGTCANIST